MKFHFMLQWLAQEKPLSFDTQAVLLHWLSMCIINMSRDQLFFWNQLCPPFGRSHYLLIIRNYIPLLIIRMVSSFQNRALALEKNSLETKTRILNHPYLFNKSSHYNPSLPPLFSRGRGTGRAVAGLCVKHLGKLKKCSKGGEVPA